MSLVDHSALRRIPLFELLDDHELADLAQHCDQASVLAGQTLFQIGDRGDTMFVVQSGQIELTVRDTSGHRIVLGMMQPGDFFGELSLLGDDMRSANAKAVEDSRLVAINRRAVEMLVTAYPNAALDIMQVLGQRLRRVTITAQERVVRNANEESEKKTTFGDRVADAVTLVTGNIGFAYFSVAWFLSWIVINSGIIPGVPPFDPYPYGLLTTTVSLEAIFLSLFVLISQNRQAARDKVRNDIEYEANLNAELGVRELREQVDELQQLVMQHFAALHSDQEEPASKGRRRK